MELTSAMAPKPSYVIKPSSNLQPKTSKNHGQYQRCSKGFKLRAPHFDAPQSGPNLARLAQGSVSCRVRKRKGYVALPAARKRPSLVRQSKGSPSNLGRWMSLSWWISSDQKGRTDNNDHWRAWPPGLARGRVE